ncbi:alpha/beta hydrolase [Breznakiella homolactica]|uniref:Alpha/beta hydrolase n=1 Tax=Breznakiella homolactica TaxID=2798577 RepID=A0A7T8BBB6_9SPIR|nr:alpha/beta hydrolase [Breznakiella homolactica]QQO09063.1 alpha/beta hydrolase [Breznakiella homolactica]
MAINSAMRAALKAIAFLDVDVKKTYKVERQFENLSAKLKGVPPEYAIWDQCVTVGDHQVQVRLFLPQKGNPRALLLFFHGGGWVTGSIESYTSMCANLAGATCSIVASVDYRLAPEHKFPAGPDDCYAVARELFLGKGFFNIRPEDIVLIGDSAGGNLAAAVSLMARDRGEFMPRRQILLYPATGNDHSENSPFPSIRENGYDYLLTSKRVQDVIELYRSSEEDLTNPYFAPLEADDLTRQPDTLIITAEYCPLRDEGEYYGKKLEEAGNKVTIYRMKDAFHAYMMLPPRFVHVKRTYQLINKFLGDCGA